MITAKFMLQAGALLAGLGVVLGAFGAHALQATLAASGRLDTYETAVRYQFYHAFALLAAGLLLYLFPAAGRWFSYSGWAFLAGTLLFCGSLYGICFTGVRALGAVAPLGGAAFVAGWLLLLVGIGRALQ